MLLENISHGRRSALITIKDPEVGHCSSFRSAHRCFVPIPQPETGMFQDVTLQQAAFCFSILNTRIFHISSPHTRGRSAIYSHHSPRVCPLQLCWGNTWVFCTDPAAGNWLFPSLDRNKRPNYCCSSRSACESLCACSRRGAMEAALNF